VHEAQNVRLKIYRTQNPKKLSTLLDVSKQLYSSTIRQQFIFSSYDFSHFTDMVCGQKLTTYCKFLANVSKWLT